MTTRPRTWKRWLLAALVLMAAGWLGTSFAVARALTRRAAPIRVEPPVAVGGVHPVELALRTEDEETLGAWWFEAEGATRTALLLHGNGGSRTGMLDAAGIYLSGGASVLAVTMRAHGDSTGVVNDFGRSAAADVRAAIAHLSERSPGTSITVHGRSLGAAAAIFAGPLDAAVERYVFECPYPDLATAVERRLDLRLLAPLDRIAWHGLRTVAPLVVDDPWSISPIAAMASLRGDVPALFLAGGRDRHSPLADVERLARAYPGPHQLVVFPAGAHERLRSSAEERYRGVLLEKF